MLEIFIKSDFHSRVFLYSDTINDLRFCDRCNIVRLIHVNTVFYYNSFVCLAFKIQEP